MLIAKLKSRAMLRNFLMGFQGHEPTCRLV